MAPANACQSQLRSSRPNLGDVAGEKAGTSTKEAYVNWFWINIPLMAVFFLAMTGIPLWLVFRHPDGREPALAHQGQTLPASVTGRHAATQAETATALNAQTALYAQTAPMRPVRLSAAGSDDEFALPELAGTRR